MHLWKKHLDDSNSSAEVERRILKGIAEFVEPGEVPIEKLAEICPDQLLYRLHDWPPEVARLVLPTIETWMAEQNNSEHNNRLAAKYLAMKDLDGCARVLRRVAFSPNTTAQQKFVALNLKADELMQRGDLRNALRAVEQAIAIDNSQKRDSHGVSERSQTLEKQEKIKKLLEQAYGD